MTDDDKYRVVRTFALRRRCSSQECRQPFWPSPMRDGSVREYGDGRHVWTCGTCLNERAWGGVAE